MHVLVAAPREVDEKQFAGRHRRRDLCGVGERVRRFERRHDAFEVAQIVKRLQRLVVGHRHVFRAPRILEPRVLRADARVIEPRRDRVRFDDLAVRILKQIRAVAVQHSRPARAERGGVFAGGEAFARGLDPDQPHPFLREVRMENTHRVRTAAHACDHRVGLPSRELGHLDPAFFADDGLEVPHHHGVRMRARDRADDVKRVFHVRHPVAHRFVERILQGSRAGFHRNDGGAEQFHAVHVRRLALHVLGTHVHHALHAVARGDRGSRHAMLARPRLGDHAQLAHAARDQRLTDRIVDLVRAGVIQVFALEEDLRAPQQLRPPPGMVDGSGPPDVMLEFVAEFGQEPGVPATLRVRVAQLLQGVRQRLGDKDSAIGTEMPV